MSGNYSEDGLIESTSMDIFRGMGWETANVHSDEVFGEDGTIGRDSETDYILKYPFLKACKKLNPSVPESAINKAFEKIISSTSTKGLVEINYDKYEQLRDGIPVDYKDGNGDLIKNKRVKVFDLKNPENNEFLAVQQLWIIGKSRRKRRPDIVGFVNGIPLVFIELKGHYRNLKEAYDDNLSDYKDTIPNILHTNALIILSNGIMSKVGSITSKYEHFNDWKRIDEDKEGVISLDIMLEGVCEKTRLLDIFENYVLFDKGSGDLQKLVPRNHQYLGVNRAINYFKEKRNLSVEESSKLGVFWHTQGSGKSYSMVFLCQKILREMGEGYTFLILTDRNELDKQIYGTFAAVGAVKDKTSRASSGGNLKKILSEDRRYVFSLIHKFNFEEVVSERKNIIVISDEAHRTQGGSLALNLRKALPNASFIGFTGTPLFKDDELTKRIFGDYVSKYDFRRSVEDGATVPLYYENRGEKLKLDNPEITEQIKDTIEKHDLDENQEEKLKNMFSREYPILTAEKRLRSIARDVVYHFCERGYKGKAMFVAIDKLTAVRMHDYITEEIGNYIRENENKISDSDMKWIKETEVNVVVSGEQNEIKKFRDWGYDIESHRLKMNTRDLEKEFKDEENPFRMAIVCAMWITGFDVKSLSTLYIDKPLKAHTLMQTIARANRVHEGKNNGLIVDYIETYKALLSALAIYGDSSSKGGDESPVKPIEELVEDLKESVDKIDLFLKDQCQFDINSIVEEENNLQKIKKIKDCYNAVCKNEDIKLKFGVNCREMFKKYKALIPNKEIYEFKPRRDAIDAVYRLIDVKVKEADITPIMVELQEIIDNSISNLNITLNKLESHGTKVDLSSLDFKKIEEEFLSDKDNQNIAVQKIKERVEEKLFQLMESNSTRINFYDRYQEIIELYNQGKDYRSIKEIFDKLIVLFGDLSEEDKRAEREGLEEEELNLFDLLAEGKKISDKERHTLKETAKQLLKKLKQKLKVKNWIEKPTIIAAVKKEIHNILWEMPILLFEEEEMRLKTDQILEDCQARY